MTIDLIRTDIHQIMYKLDDVAKQFKASNGALLDFCFQRDLDKSKEFNSYCMPVITAWQYAQYFVNNYFALDFNTKHSWNDMCQPLKNSWLQIYDQLRDDFQKVLGMSVRKKLDALSDKMSAVLIDDTDKFKECITLSAKAIEGVVALEERIKQLLDEINQLMEMAKETV